MERSKSPVRYLGGTRRQNEGESKRRWRRKREGKRELDDLFREESSTGRSEDTLERGRGEHGKEIRAAGVPGREGSYTEGR